MDQRIPSLRWHLRKVMLTDVKRRKDSWNSVGAWSWLTRSGSHPDTGVRGMPLALGAVNPPGSAGGHLPPSAICSGCSTTPCASVRGPAICYM